MKKILVTNDDGVHSEGIHALAAALSRLGEVVVIAPHVEASAIGHALTLRRPLRMEQLRPGVYEVDGTPTDCVNVAITQLYTAPPDLVVSGSFAESRPVILQRVDRSIILQRLQGTAKVSVKDRRSGRVVKSFDVYAISEFMPDQPNGLLSPETPDLAEDQAVREWTRRMAIDVVEGLEPGF